VLASTIHALLCRGSCISSTQLNSPNGANTAYIHFENLVCRKYSVQKLTQVSQGNNVVDAPVSNTHGFLSRDTWVSSTQLNRPI
jgi:hypothetical protein